MVFDHVIALTHVVGAGLGLALVTSVGRRLTHTRRPRFRFDDAPRRRRWLRTSVQMAGWLVRETGRLAAGLGLALVTPLGLLWANQRYPLVAPVLAPFEARLSALGHRPAHARCFPLLVWHLWLVRCAGCRRQSLFREVPAANGAGVELKVLGKDTWRARRCPAEYLTMQPLPTAAITATVRPGRRLRPRMRPAPIQSPSTPASAPIAPPAKRDRTA